MSDLLKVIQLVGGRTGELGFKAKQWDLEYLLFKPHCLWLSKHTHTLPNFCQSGSLAISSEPITVAWSWPALIRFSLSLLLPKPGSRPPHGQRVERGKFSREKSGNCHQKKDAAYQKQQKSTHIDVKFSPLIASWAKFTYQLFHIYITNHPGHP